MCKTVMTAKEAHTILHPDTSAASIWEIKMDVSDEAAAKAVEEACVVGCEALEKQIPKKPKKKETTEKTHYLCPTCGYIPITIYADGYRLGNQPQYCEKCGQALDWSE